MGLANYRLRLQSTNFITKKILQKPKKKTVINYSGCRMLHWTLCGKYLKNQGHKIKKIIFGFVNSNFSLRRYILPAPHDTTCQSCVF